MISKRVLGFCIGWLISTTPVFGASDVADAAMKGNKEAVRALLQQKANVNAPQSDGTTALHWAVRSDDLETADLLIRAGANVSAANRDGATPLLLASINGNAAMLERLIKAGADPNASLTKYGDTALMLAARTGKTDAVKMLLEPIAGKPGAQVNAKETWGDTTALMWAVSELHPAIVKMLIDHGADVNARSKFVPSTTGRGFEGTTPVASKPDQTAEEHASGLLTPLMFAAREGDVESARLLVAAGADVNAVDGDGKDVLGLAIFNGNYELASFLIDKQAKVNRADAQGFTPLFWATDRRNMETPPNFPWMVTTDPLPLIKKLLDAGANPNALVNNTPRARMRDGSPRIVYATALMRAAFSGDLELVKLLVAHGADPHIVSKDNETTLMAAAGTGFINGYSKGRSAAERLEVVKLLVQLGEDVNAADNYGITPLMVAANMGEMPIIQYLIDKGADLGAYDLGKKNDGAFGSSIEPLMPIDYAIGVGTFVPNNAVIIHEDAVKLMSRLMQERGIKHTTSECTLRGFTCSGANVDPKTATPAEIAKIRKIQTGYQVDGITGGLAVKDQDKPQK
jgi:ankyrin repeat protein